MNTDFDRVEFDTNNPEPRCPCLLLLDTSASMDGERINSLNAGLVTFREALEKDELALLRVEIAIVSFGGQAELVQDFVTANQFVPPTLSTSGLTPMGSGINLALDLIEERKKTYKKNVPHYRPWVFLITDGEPTDGELWKEAARRVQAAESNRKVAFFAVGVGGDAKLNILAQITQREPVRLDGLKFHEMFLWLSSSMSKVSHSELDAGVPLQDPITSGWAKV